MNKRTPTPPETVQPSEPTEGAPIEWSVANLADEVRQLQASAAVAAQLYQKGQRGGFEQRFKQVLQQIDRLAALLSDVPAP